MDYATAMTKSKGIRTLGWLDPPQTPPKRSLHSLALGPCALVRSQSSGNTSQHYATPVDGNMAAWCKCFWHSIPPDQSSGPNGCNGGMNGCIMPNLGSKQQPTTKISFTHAYSSRSPWLRPSPSRNVTSSPLWPAFPTFGQCRECNDSTASRRTPDRTYRLHPYWSPNS